MPLPRGDEYNQAVQSPRLCFSDSILQNCHVETTPLGLPKPYSGGFTTTYRLLNSNNSWAVRCFTREISDLQRRYQAIGAFLNTNVCSILVEAKYVSNGIRVNGTFHPIIKMKWLDGETLNIFIGKNYNNKNVIQQLLIEFQNLVNTLGSFGIAHGDLQHGNIIVKNNKQYLIDYDGMYFPELASLKVNELGHPNFQHPRRTTNDYNKDIDRFAAIVIYTALKAITVAPSLWTKYDNGDNILFKGKDFTDPQNSPLFRDLIGYTELSKLANNLLAICTKDFGDIPVLNDFITKTYIPSVIVLPPTIPRSPYPVIDGTQKGRLGEYIGQKVMVIGKISALRNGTTRHGNPYMFMNFGVYPYQTFTIVLWSEALAAFGQKGINPDSFRGKFICITGVLGNYSGTPQIAVDFTSQIQVLSGETEAKQYLSSNNSTPAQKRTITPNKPVGKFDEIDDILNDIYKNKPVTPKPQIKTPSYSHSPTSSTYRPTSSTTSKGHQQKTSSNSGCMVTIIIAVVGGLIGIAATQDASGFFGGTVIAGFIGLFISKAIN